MDPEGENPVLPKATGSAKGGLWLSIRCERHLLVGLHQVKCGNKPGSPQPFNEVIYLWQRVAVKL